MPMVSSFVRSLLFWRHLLRYHRTSLLLLSSSLYHSFDVNWNVVKWQHTHLDTRTRTQMNFIPAQTAHSRIGFVQLHSSNSALRKWVRISVSVFTVFSITLFLFCSPPFLHLLSAYFHLQMYLFRCFHGYRSFSHSLMLFLLRVFLVKPLREMVEKGKTVDNIM